MYMSRVGPSEKNGFSVTFDDDKCNAVVRCRSGANLSLSESNIFRMIAFTEFARYRRFTQGMCSKSQSGCGETLDLS